VLSVTRCSFSSIGRLLHKNAPRIKQARFTQDLQGAGLDGVSYIPGSNGFRGFEGLRLGKQTDAMNAATRRAVWDGAFAA
jgi:hypothetical protein